MQSPSVGQRLTDKAPRPDADVVRNWIGPDAFAHWVALQEWIESAYPGVFIPEWVYGGSKHGWSLRYKKSKGLCTFVPEYRRFSVVVVLGAGERAKFDARRGDWRASLVALYDTTETFRDGKWLKIDISSVEDRNDAAELISLKRPLRRQHE